MKTTAKIIKLNKEQYKHLVDSLKPQEYLGIPTLNELTTLPARTVYQIPGTNHLRIIRRK